MDWRKYCKPENWHRYANLFPAMNAEELDSLADNIKKNGLLEPIKLFEGKVLDGRNRALACAKANEEPRFVEWHRNGVTPLDFVIAENLERRHLNTTQRAALAAMVLPQLRKEARVRQEAAGEHGFKGGRGRSKGKPLAKNCAKGLGKSAEQAAIRFGVSARTIEKAAALGTKKRGILGKMAKGKLTLQQADKELNCRGKLHLRFVAPPFSVLDARQGYWQERKRFWREQGVNGGHNQQLSGNQPNMDLGSYSDTSVFDPVLAEFIYRSFAPVNGRVLDPFAGEPTKGLVAAKCGLQYTGIELRPEQVEENRKRANELNVSPTWHRGDSANLLNAVPAKERFDLIFTSPPYFDLEIYSRHKKDGSAFRSYEKFMEWYENIFRQAVARLKPNRFLVVKVGDVRDATGFYRNFVGDNISCFLGMGLRLYNEAILVTPPGTAALRANGQFPNYRKMVKTHQNVLCFFKGDNPKVIPHALGVLANGGSHAR
jgi:DNA modification methylase